MSIIIRFVYLCIFNCILLANFNQNTFISDNPHIIAVMVEFEKELPNDPLTSGDGSFLDSLDIDMVWNDENNGMKNLRCNQFIVDRPPHDSSYFHSQINAVSNYFKSSSNDNIIITSHIIMNPNHSKGYYKLSKKMEQYAHSDNDLSVLFKESLDIAKTDIELYLNNNPDISFNDIIFTVFHSGIGQDFSFPTFDPTIYDIKSAYIEESMFDDMLYPNINGNDVKTGILLPETQNMVFFDSIEDIFYGYDSYCDFQLGLTGTFSFLMGYALGLPPLFNTETGDPGVGIFGLMDYGSNNGRGVIPSLPSPWTRILKNWSTPINMTDSCSTSPLIFDLYSDKVYQFDISDYEYFLIENRLNQLNGTFTIDSIVSSYNNSEYDYYSNWFDALIDGNDEFDIFEFSSDSVIISVNDYNLGLPGSGLLIWHIDESTISLDNDINNNPNNRVVSIEEADGARDIGFENYALFANDNPTNGTRWDFWYMGNTAHYYTNDNDEICIDPNNYDIWDHYTYESICEQNGGLWIKPVIFDKFSNPNSNLTSGIDSFFSFEILDSVSMVTKVKVKYESPIEYIDYTFNYDKIVGTSPSNIYFALNDSIYLFNFTNELEYFGPYNSDNSIVLTNNLNESNIYEINHEYAYLNLDNELIDLDYQEWFGYFSDLDNPDRLLYQNNEFIIDDNSIPNIDHIPSESISIGDIDKDGFDEIVYTSTNGMIVAYNINGTLVNGFPIQSNYHGPVLIINNSDDLVLICRNNHHIDIISLAYGLLHSLPSNNQDSDILAINNKLTDGSRFYNFSIDDNYSYWLQKYSNHSHYPVSSGIHEEKDYTPNHSVVSNFYNYPNPIKQGKTKFRFFINSATNSININIYSLSGHLVDQLSLSSILLNEYNEIEWNIGNLLPGLYFAEIISDNGKEDIIKLVIGY